MIELILNGPIVPKARPRFSGRVYLPERYRIWKLNAIAQFLLQYDGAPIQKASVQIDLHGPLRGDLDNLAGAILDALVQSEVILDDRLSCVPKLQIEHIPGKSKGAIVRLDQL